MTTILHGGRRYGKTLEQQVYIQIAMVQHNLKQAAKWSKTNKVWKYGHTQAKWHRNYNRRMAAKHMVKMYLLIKGFPNGAANT